MLNFFLPLLFALLSVITAFDAPKAHAQSIRSPTMTSTHVQPQRIIRIAIPAQQTLDNNTDVKFQSLTNFLQEFWQIWAIDHGYHIKFVPMPSSQSDLALNNNEIDVIAISTINNRQPNTLYSMPYARYKQRFYRLLKGSNDNSITIGIHDEQHSTLSFLGQRIKRDYYDNISALLDNFSTYDALYSVSPWRLEEQLKERQLLQHFYLSSDEAPKIYFHATTRAADRQLMYDINEGIRHVSKTQAKLWSRKYFLIKQSSIELTLGDYFFDLSESEKQYLIDHNQLNYIITEAGFPPYIITKSFANISERGFSIELANVVTKKTGILFKPYYVDDVQSSVKAILEKKADITLIMEQSEDRAYAFDFTIPYVNSHYSLITRNEANIANNLSDLTHETIAAVSSFNATKVLIEQFPNANIKIYNSLNAALQAVAQGDANVLITHSLISGYLIKELQLSNLVSQPFSQFKKDSKLSFAVRKGSPNVVSLINRSINSISADQFDKIYSKWSNSALPEQNVQLHVDNAYRQASYVLGVVMLLSGAVIWIYFRQLKIQRNAQQHVEQALATAEAARTEAERSAQAKITFLARMSHEIRTPMNGVLGMAEALRFSKLDEKQIELLETLQGSATNLLALLNDVLDFSKMDAGKLTLESVPVNVQELSKNIMTSFSHQPNEKQVKLRLHVDESINQLYLTDPTRLTQILNNLLSNALKFTHQGMIDLSITLVGQQTVEQVRYDKIKFAVRDTGIGIAKDKQALLFTPFIQADDDITRKFGGTGLGLSICREIVNAMGGNIMLESNEGSGSLFHFTLTLKQTESPLEVVERRQHKRIDFAPQDNRFEGFRVLVAEDNIINVAVITAQLERLNIVPDIAENGQEALNMHLAQAYDIIISDCHMPVLDGFELAQTLTANPSTRALWLIAVTADALIGSAEKCIAAGFDDYLAKPCPQEDINNKMYHALRQLIKRRMSMDYTNTNKHTLNLFNPQLLLKENDHDIVLASNFAAIFIEAWQQDKKLLKTALASNDYANIHAITHKCKGGARYLCRQSIDESAIQLEKYAQAQNQANTMLSAERFITQLDQLTKEISNWLADL